MTPLSCVITWYYDFKIIFHSTIWLLCSHYLRADIRLRTSHLWNNSWAWSDSLFRPCEVSKTSFTVGFLVSCRFRHQSSLVWNHIVCPSPRHGFRLASFNLASFDYHGSPPGKRYFLHTRLYDPFLSLSLAQAPQTPFELSRVSPQPIIMRWWGGASIFRFLWQQETCSSAWLQPFRLKRSAKRQQQVRYGFLIRQDPSHRAGIWR